MGRPAGPSGALPPYQTDSGLIRADFSRENVVPDQLQWGPLPLPGPEQPTDFLQGWATFCGAGSPELRHGMAIHSYACNRPMERRAMCNSDGDLLIVPQTGALRLKTEMGLLTVAPGEICVVQRGIKFQVLVDGPSRGYVAEIFEGHFVLPDLGPVGAWGLANPRDFETPTARYEDAEEPWYAPHSCAKCNCLSPSAPSLLLFLNVSPPPRCPGPAPSSCEGQEHEVVRVGGGGGDAALRRGRSGRENSDK